MRKYRHSDVYIYQCDLPRILPFPRFLSLKIRAIITAIKPSITAPNTPDTVPSATVRPGNVKTSLKHTVKPCVAATRKDQQLFFKTNR